MKVYMHKETAELAVVIPRHLTCWYAVVTSKRAGFITSAYWLEENYECLGDL